MESALVALIVVGFGLWLWNDARRKQERAMAAVRLLLRGTGAQLLDGTVALQRLGMAAMNQNDYPLAIQCLEKAVQLEPDHVPSIVNLGIAYIRAERVGEALRWVEEAERLMPDHPRVQNLRETYESAR